jgi:DNA-binding transcriptional MerR regulator
VPDLRNRHALTFARPVTREKIYSQPLFFFSSLAFPLSNATILRLLLRNAIDTAHVVWSPHSGASVSTRFARLAGATRANQEVVEMLDKQTRGAILLLRRKGHSLRRISRLLSLSHDSVREVVKVGSDEPPIILRTRKLDAHRERIARLLLEFDGNVVKVHRALADAGTSVRYSTLTRFCRNNHLLNRACDPRRSAAAARQWLLALVNGRHSVEYLQSQLSPATDLQFLFSQLKHGRSRHRKKAATILARKQGISNSVIARALRSSRSTTR